MKRNDTLVYGRCGSYDRGVNEMELAGLTPVPSEVVKPPRVAESVVQLECKLRGTHEVKNAAGHITGLIVIGEVNDPKSGRTALNPKCHSCWSRTVAVNITCAIESVMQQECCVGHMVLGLRLGTSHLGSSLAT